MGQGSIRENLGPPIYLVGGGLGQGASEKNWTPYVFLQPLKLATSNLVHNFRLGLPYQKTTFKIKIGGGLSQGTSKRNLGPLRISATVEANKFKCGRPTQIGFRTSLAKNNI